MLRKVKISDAAAITKIYNFHVYNTIATFDLEPISIQEMETKITTITKNHPWFVYELNNVVVGYTYANYWKMRSAYNTTVESSIYIAEEAVGKGIGNTLYQHLLTELKNRNMNIVIGGISLPNNASVHIHEKFGFEKVAHFKKIGFKFNKWIDVTYWQLALTKI